MTALNPIKFSNSCRQGLPSYTCPDTDKFSVIYNPVTGLYYLKINNNGQWVYPTWRVEGFNSILDIENWLSARDWQSATLDYLPDTLESSKIRQDDFDTAMKLLGLHLSDTQPKDARVYEVELDSSVPKRIQISYESDGTVIPLIWKDGKISKPRGNLHSTHDLATLIYDVEQVLAHHHIPAAFESIMTSRNDRNSVITAAINVRDLTSNMVRVKSSNIWSYSMDIQNAGDDTGDVVVQFKGTKGGPGDIYIYYDVPVVVYRRWHTAPSKGHYFWVNIRNHFKYSKLTGDKRGKLPNAIN